MHVLIVDDNPDKVAIIQAFIDGLESRATKTFSVADNMGEAISQFTTYKFDLIIIDLMLPAFPDAQKDSSAGAGLVDILRRPGGPNVATPALGLSAYPSEVESFRERFEKHGILITNFDDADSWKMPVEALVQEAQRVRNDKRAVDFVIVVALEEERSAFAHSNLDILRPLIVAGLNVLEVRTKHMKPLYGVIVRLSQMGLVASTFESTVALANFNSPIFCMSGICAGIEAHTKLGQIVVASSSWDYQTGKWADNDFEISALQVLMPATTRVILDLACADSDLTRSLEDMLPDDIDRPTQRSAPLMAPLATGSAVIADADRIKLISRQHRKLAGIDMECFGLYHACHHSITSVKHFFAVKSVVDFANNKKGDRIHRYGCIVSARICLSFIERLHAYDAGQR